VFFVVKININILIVKEEQDEKRRKKGNKNT
jgi:hypothetical protein